MYSFPQTIAPGVWICFTKAVPQARIFDLKPSQSDFPVGNSHLRKRISVQNDDCFVTGYGHDNDNGSHALMDIAGMQQSGWPKSATPGTLSEDRLTVSGAEE